MLIAHNHPRGLRALVGLPSFSPPPVRPPSPVKEDSARILSAEKNLLAIIQSQKERARQFEGPFEVERASSPRWPRESPVARPGPVVPPSPSAASPLLSPSPKVATSASQTTVSSLSPVKVEPGDDASPLTPNALLTGIVRVPTLPDDERAAGGRYENGDASPLQTLSSYVERPVQTPLDALPAPAPDLPVPPSPASVPLRNSTAVFGVSLDPTPAKRSPAGLIHMTPVPAPTSLQASAAAIKTLRSFPLGGHLDDESDVLSEEEPDDENEEVVDERPQRPFSELCSPPMTGDTLTSTSHFGGSNEFEISFRLRPGQLLPEGSPPIETPQNILLDALLPLELMHHGNEAACNCIAAARSALLDLEETIPGALRVLIEEAGRRLLTRHASRSSSKPPELPPLSPIPEPGETIELDASSAAPAIDLDLAQQQQQASAFQPPPATPQRASGNGAASGSGPVVSSSSLSFSDSDPRYGSVTRPGDVQLVIEVDSVNGATPSPHPGEPTLSSILAATSTGTELSFRSPLTTSPRASSSVLACLFTPGPSMQLTPAAAGPTPGSTDATPAPALGSSPQGASPETTAPPGGDLGSVPEHLRRSAPPLVMFTGATPSPQAIVATASLSAGPGRKSSSNLLTPLGRHLTGLSQRRLSTMTDGENLTPTVSGLGGSGLHVRKLSKGGSGVSATIAGSNIAGSNLGLEDDDDVGLARAPGGTVPF